jgi:lysophospholipase L1-like esterase
MKGKTYILFYLFIFFFIFCLFTCFFTFIFKYNSKEPMTNNDTIVLIGDSILNNNMYVPVGKSVADNIKLLHGNNIIIGAKDGATIDTCYQQFTMNNIINSENYFLFISIGGNDILNNNDKNFDKLKKKYIKLIDFIKEKDPKTKINLLNLYFPTDEKYNKYEKIITEWNKMISSLCEKNKYNLLRLDNLLTNASDFTHGIEPSAIGSEKIAKLIVDS